MSRQAILVILLLASLPDGCARGQHNPNVDRLKAGLEPLDWGETADD